MRDFFKGLLLLPIKIYGKFIPSLPDSTDDFNTLQRLWLVFSVVYFYGFSLFLLVIALDPTSIIFTTEGVSIIALNYSASVIAYHGITLTVKALSILFAFIFEKDVGKIKDNFKSASGKINSQLILRYLLILLVIVIIVVILIGAFR